MSFTCHYFHIQFNNVSTCNITSPLIKKPEKDFGFNAVGRGCGKLCIPLSSRILAMPLRFIAEGFYCLLPYWRRQLILYHRVNSLRTSIVSVWSLDVKQILDMISEHL